MIRTCALCYFELSEVSSQGLYVAANTLKHQCKDICIYVQCVLLINKVIVY